jgi:hypothetical protein
MIGHQHHRFEIAQIFVGAPVLGKLDRGTHQLVRILLELGFEPLQKREGIGCRAGKTGDDLALAKAPDLARITLHHGLAEAHLAIARHHHLSALPDGNNRCHETTLPGFRAFQRAAHRPC